MDMRIPPLRMKILLESDPLKSIILVRRLVVSASSAGALPPGVGSSRCADNMSLLSGPETGKRERVTRKTDGKLALLVNLGGVLARKADAFGYPLHLTHFCLPVSGPQICGSMAKYVCDCICV